MNQPGMKVKEEPREEGGAHYPRRIKSEKVDDRYDNDHRRHNNDSRRGDADRGRDRGDYNNRKIKRERHDGGGSRGGGGGRGGSRGGRGGNRGGGGGSREDQWGKRKPKEERDIKQDPDKAAKFGAAIEDSKEEDEEKKKLDKEKPNFALSGKLGEETNTYKGVVIKYGEPAEARVPQTRWRLYAFKGEEKLPILHIHRQSAYLIGRDRRISDIPVDHPSCSKQHAVLQYRLVAYKKANGVMGRRVRPYLLDLGSANGTYVNGQRIDAQKYVELLEKDLIKFGFSSREYVLLRDDSVDSDPDE